MANKVAAVCALVSMGFGAVVTTATPANADNRRLNNTIYVNIYTMQHQAGCQTEAKEDGRLADAARRHAVDAVNNPQINGDVGTDDSTPQIRASEAGFVGRTAQTVATNPALAINGIDVLGQWYWDPVARGIIENCANIAIGVWSENTLTRSVVVAVYGQPT